jgi:hypothetical protein
MSGLYPSTVLVERFLASVSAETMAQKFIAPCDLEILGMLLVLGTAAGAGDGVTVNVSNNPVAQANVASTQLSPNPYNLWTAANVPSVAGSATSNITSGTITTNAYLGALLENKPYALEYPFPGPPGTVGFETAQQTSQITSAPVTTPPTIVKFGITAGLVAPDNTYTDANGFTSTPTSTVHEGDILSFVIGAISSVGAAANLEIVLYGQVR